MCEICFALKLSINFIPNSLILSMFKILKKNQNNKLNFKVQLLSISL